MSQEIGSGPVQEEYVQRMHAMAQVIDEHFNPQGPAKREIGFVLMVFPFGDSSQGRCNYMSNAARADVITLLKEQLAYFQGAPDNQEGHA
jgi:hypothetical protein